MPDISSRLKDFIRELRRRKVVRVAVVYFLAAWVLIQVADSTFEHLPLPDGSITLVIVLAALGFPFALVMAWAYNLTPQGLKREEQKVSGGADTADVQAEVSDASIAVLAFADMSPDRDQEYFCDGVAEEILSTLSQIPDLHVASRTSSFRFKGQALDVGEIARQLKVRTVLEGSVRKSGEQLRITAQLIDARNGYHLWSARYDRDMKDIFSIQAEIAIYIAEALEVKLVSETCKAACTNNVEAYDYYLRGWTYFHRQGPKNMQFARQMFSRAIDIDPSFAKAWAGLADSYGYEYLYYNSDPENYVEASKASQKALEFAPDLAEARTSRGFAHSLCGEFEDAQSEFEQAIRINPNLFEAYYLYARTCFHQGMLDKAAELFEKASQVRPLDYQTPILLSRIRLGQGRIEEAKRIARKALPIAERVLQLKPDETRALYLGAGPLFLLGERDKAFEWTERALFLDPYDPTLVYNVTCFYAQAGEIEKAIDCLEQNALPGSASMAWLEHDADLDPLRDHPRFKQLLEGLEK